MNHSPAPDQPTQHRRRSLFAFGNRLTSHEHEERRKSSVTFAESPDSSPSAQASFREAHPGRVSPLSPRTSVAVASDGSSEKSAAPSRTENEEGEDYVPPSALDEPASDELSWTCVSATNPSIQWSYIR